MQSCCPSRPQSIQRQAHRQWQLAAVHAASSILCCGTCCGACRCDILLLRCSRKQLQWGMALQKSRMPGTLQCRLTFARRRTAWSLLCGGAQASLPASQLPHSSLLQSCPQTAHHVAGGMLPAAWCRGESWHAPSQKQTRSVGPAAEGTLPAVDRTAHTGQHQEGHCRLHNLQNPAHLNLTRLHGQMEEARQTGRASEAMTASKVAGRSLQLSDKAWAAWAGLRW